MNGRPTTPPPIAVDRVRASGWVTPASPTRPGPPVTVAPPTPASRDSQPSQAFGLAKGLPITEPTGIPRVDPPPTPYIIEKPTSGGPVEVIVEDPEAIKQRAKAEEEEEERIQEAIEAEKRRRNRTIPQMDDDDLNALIRSAQKVRVECCAPA
jgi:hypothetical protein